MGIDTLEHIILINNASQNTVNILNERNNILQIDSKTNIINKNDYNGDSQSNISSIYKRTQNVSNMII